MRMKIIMKLFTFILTTLGGLALMSILWWYLFSFVNNQTHHLSSPSSQNSNNIISTRPTLRRRLASYAVEEDEEDPTMVTGRRDGGGWSSLSKKPICSRNEFLLDLSNLDNDKQINIFYSKGENGDRLTLTSGSARSQVNQCCPYYDDVGIDVYYKFHNDHKWFKYPHRINRTLLKNTNNVLRTQTKDFIEEDKIIPATAD